MQGREWSGASLDLPPPSPKPLVQVVVETDFAGPHAGGTGEFASIGENRKGKEHVPGTRPDP